MRADHPVACEFRAAWGAQPSPPLGVGFLAFHVPGVGLVVKVINLPVTAFNPDYLREGPAHGRDLMSPFGEAIWRDLRDVGLQVVDRRAPGSAVATVMDAQVIAGAKAALAATERTAA